MFLDGAKIFSHSLGGQSKSSESLAVGMDGLPIQHPQPPETAGFDVVAKGPAPGESARASDLGEGGPTLLGRAKNKALTWPEAAPAPRGATQRLRATLSQLQSGIPAQLLPGLA